MFQTPLLSPTSEDPKVELSVKEEGNLIPPASCEVKTNSEIADNPPTEPMASFLYSDKKNVSLSYGIISCYRTLSFLPMLKNHLAQVTLPKREKLIVLEMPVKTLQLKERPKVL